MNSRIMNSRIVKYVLEKPANFWLSSLLAVGLVAFSLAGRLGADEQRTVPELTVHEWGTFTAVAGRDGQAVEWTPLNGFSDLPQFVEHISDVHFKVGLRGTIRMETPVLYFYSLREMSVSARVSFAKGLITEWYPHADWVQPEPVLPNTRLSQLQTDGSITWSDVTVSPNLAGEFLREMKANRYYAARETFSSPLRVKTSAGEQQEKFLFYRGVSASSLPLSAKLNSSGKLVLNTLGEDEIPGVILFERRGDRIAYRLAGPLTGETILDPPEPAGSVDSLRGDLEELLVAHGLYREEAHAMVETWNDSWFEEGSRVIYIVPRGFIDRILPLTVNPEPGQTVRVFVGRLEILSPATVEAVRIAVANKDEATLNKYRRFLEPILQAAREKRPQAVVE